MFKLFSNNNEKYINNLIKETENDKKFLYGINPKYKNQDNKLLKMYGKCDSLENSIKLIVITDNHGCLNEDVFLILQKRIKNMIFAYCLEIIVPTI